LIKFKVKLPSSEKYNGDKVLRDIGSKLAKRVHNTYTELTGDWKQDGQREIDTPVNFQEKITKDSNGMLVEVKTDSLKYRYVDLGTEAHPIEPRPNNARGLLVFSSKFTPRTKPGDLKTGSGGKDTGSPTVFTPYVNHPGIKEPRNFEAAINQEQMPIIMDDLKAGLSKIVGASYKVEDYG
jgi:hypothetical protein